MNTSFKILKKIFLIFLIFLIVSFFVYWFRRVYPSDGDAGMLRDKEGLERILLSFSIALLYYLLGLIDTITGRLSNPFNFFLYIYGSENEDFHRIDPKADYR